MLIAPPIGVIALYVLAGLAGGLIALWLLARTLWRWWRQRAFPVDMLQQRRTLALAAAALLCGGLTFILIWPLALVCVLCTLWLLAGVHAIRSQGMATAAGADAQTDAIQPRWRRGPLVLLAAVALAYYALLGYGLLLHHQWALERHYAKSRRHFILPRAMSYGELLVPAGSLVHRLNDDPQDRNSQPRPLTLTHLQQLRFAQPMPVGSIWATALSISDYLDLYELELARDQHIGPVLLEAGSDRATARPIWRIDPQRSTLHCRRGDIAIFTTAPTSAPDTPPQPWQSDRQPDHPSDHQPDHQHDGAQARFFPSRWGIIRCQPGAIDVPPAYTGPAPWGAADTPVWAE